MRWRLRRQCLYRLQFPCPSLPLPAYASVRRVPSPLALLVLVPPDVRISPLCIRRRSSACVALSVLLLLKVHPPLRVFPLQVPLRELPRASQPPALGEAQR